VNLLLDTQVFLWWADASERLGPLARAAIQAPEHMVWVSAASFWEIAIKAGIGRLELSEPAEMCLPREMARSGFRELSVTIAHALAVQHLPPHHKDPFDRLLLSQAIVESMCLVTSDRALSAYQARMMEAGR
jgi:PIN domain nuclease of toxin-antitoxin system